MKNCIILLGLFLFSATIAQKKEKLYYFTEQDSLVGLKNQKGEIIISPEQVWDFEIYKNYQEELKAKLLILSFKNGPMHRVYDRSGKFLLDLIL